MQFSADKSAADDCGGQWGFSGKNRGFETNPGENFLRAVRTAGGCGI